MRIMTIALLTACLAAAPAAGAEGNQKHSNGQSEPRGQTVSGCNHQANDVGVKGKERKNFVERCIARGGDKWRAEDMKRSCSERAERQGMKGEAREEFIHRCRGYRDDPLDEAAFGGRLRECASAAERTRGTREQRRQYVERCMNRTAPEKTKLKAGDDRRPDHSDLDDKDRREPNDRRNDDAVKHKD